MKVLIVPMPAMAETSGPISRCVLLAGGLKQAAIETATCMAKDVNFRRIEGVPNYDLDVPMPLGLPPFIATRTFPIAQKLGITARKPVRSFDEVLQLTGNLDHGYLKRSVAQIARAIDQFEPDVVYSEFNLSALIAAKQKGVPLCATVSFPTQHAYAHNKKTARGLNRFLEESSMKQVSSALELFELADRWFCPSIKELEPFEAEKVVFCGALKKAGVSDRPRNKILMYMGNGTISAKEMLRVAKPAFAEMDYEVYIASSYLKEQTLGNLHIAPRWDFQKLLDEAVLFVNHGGQNSVVDGLIHGVPQIVVPGRVFERKYNAAKLAENHAGRCLTREEFTPVGLRKASEEVIRSPEMRSRAQKLGRLLMDAGGIDAVVSRIAEFGETRS